MEVLEERVDDHHVRLVDLEATSGMHERRLHELEADRRTVRHLGDLIEALATRSNDALDTVDAVAERAVERVLERRHERRIQGWQMKAGWVSAVAALGGLGFELFFR